MSGKAFIDTNVLIYAHDVDAAAKHKIARRVLRELWSGSQVEHGVTRARNSTRTRIRRVCSPAGMLASSAGWARCSCSR